MNEHPFDNPLRAAVKSLTDVVAPALDPTNPLANEQLRLVCRFLEYTRLRAAYLPERLSAAALVNAVATCAEAKAQALWDLSVPATGTCTDATVLCCPEDGPAEPYGGPRSTWGARLARAVHAAVTAGGKAWMDAPKSWSGPVG